MEHRPDTPEGVRELRRRTELRLNELRMLTEGEHIFWTRSSPSLKREMTIYPETLTPEQQQRLDQIEKQLLEMAHDATKEKTSKTVLKESKRPIRGPKGSDA